MKFVATEQNVDRVKEVVIEIDAHCHDIETKLTSIDASMVEIDGELEELSYDVAGVKADVADVKTDVTDVKTAVNSVKNDVSSVKQDVARVKEDCVGIGDTVDDIQNTVGNTRTVVNSIASGMATASQIVSVSSTMAENQTETVGKLDEIIELLSKSGDITVRTINVSKKLTATRSITTVNLGTNSIVSLNAPYIYTSDLTLEEKRHSLVILYGSFTCTNVYLNTPVILSSFGNYDYIPVPPGFVCNSRATAIVGDFSVERFFDSTSASYVANTRGSATVFLNSSMTTDQQRTAHQLRPADYTPTNNDILLCYSWIAKSAIGSTETFFPVSIYFFSDNVYIDAHDYQSDNYFAMPYVLRITPGGD